LTLSLLQGAIVALGDMFLLHAYVASPGAFFLISLWASVVFSMIIYTTVATF
jgi:putative phage infection protein